MYNLHLCILQFLGWMPIWIRYVSMVVVKMKDSNTFRILKKNVMKNIQIQTDNIQRIVHYKVSRNKKKKHPTKTWNCATIWIWLVKINCKIEFDPKINVYILCRKKMSIQSSVILTWPRNIIKWLHANCLPWLLIFFLILFIFYNVESLDQDEIKWTLNSD